MSTPISRNNKLQGPALYAPPRVRDRFVFQDRAFQDRTAMVETPPQDEAEQSAIEQPEMAQFEAEQPETEQSEHDQSASAESADCGVEADETALDWVDEAIRAVIEIEHASGGLAAPGPTRAARQSPSLAPERDESEPRPAPPFRTQQEDRGDVRRAPLRRPRLQPEIVPEPPVAMERGAFPLVMRFSLVVIFAAIVAYGLTMLSSSQPGMPWLKGAGAGDRVAAAVPQSQQSPPVAQTPSRLVVEDQEAFANQPLSLAVSIEHARDNELLLFDGLAHGTTLSAGRSTSPSGWRLPYNKLRGLYLYAPKDFVGVMKTAVDLVGPDKRLLDSRTVQLKWLAQEPKPAATAAFATASAEATAGDHIGAPRSAIPGVAPIDPGEAEMLMQKGRDFLSSGDISAARVAFRRLADAGVADAALALANTYDPEYLAAHNFIGMRGDSATARALYQRAKELGSPEADRILARMVGN